MTTSARPASGIIASKSAAGPPAATGCNPGNLQDMANHGNRNWQRRWTWLDDGARAEHSSGALAHFRAGALAELVDPPADYQASRLRWKATLLIAARLADGKAFAGPSQ